MKKILLLAAGLTFALFTFGQLTGIEWEVYHVHDETEYDEPDLGVFTLDGYTTYRLFANLTNPDDFVSSVSGDINNPMFLRAACGECDAEQLFFQHPSANTSALGPLNDAFFSFLPSMEYDSHVTLGWHFDSEYDLSGSLGAVEDPDASWISEFNAGNAFEMNTNIGGVWFTTISDESAFAYAGDDLRVCLGQFTSTCDLEFLGSIQVFVNGEQPTDGDGTVHGLYSNTSGETTGCTDVTASNYDATAQCDDGSCIYPCTLDITDVIVTDVACNAFNTGALEVITAGGQGLVLHSATEDATECSGGGVASNNISGLFAGNYLVCVEDSEGCTDNMMVTVSEPEAFDVSLSGITFPSCADSDDGEICLNITGGFGGPYFVSNSNDSSTAVEGSCAGGYEGGSNVVYIWEDLDCAAFISDGINVPAPAPPVINANDFADASCANISDGEVIVVGQGGTAPFTFELSLGDEVVATVTSPEDGIIGGLPCGNYTINMTDGNDCPADAVSNINVECPDLVEVNLLEITDISCPGDEDGIISTTGAGGNATTFQYNIGATQEEAEAGPFNNTTGEFTDLAAGEWWIASESSGCAGSASFTVDAPDPISYDLVTTEATPGAADGEVCVENEGGGTGDISWYWLPNFETTDCVSGLTEDDIVTLVISDDNDCELTEEINMGLFELENNISISMFPNPTNGIININAEGLNGQEVSATITNSLGAIVQGEEFGNISGVWNKEINLSNKADGIYFLNLTIGDQEVTYRVVKN